MTCIYGIVESLGKLNLTGGKLLTERWLQRRTSILSSGGEPAGMIENR